MLAFAAAILFQTTPEYLVVDSFIFGYRLKGVWHKNEDIKASKAPVSFRGVGFGNPSGAWRSSGITLQPESQGVYVEGSGAPIGTQFSGRATFPRPVQALSVKNPVYVGELRKFLLSKGVKSPPRIKRLLSVDLDGDGSKEILLEASSRDDLTRGGMSAGKAGDYSLILFRYAKGGKAVNQVVQFDHAGAGQMPYENKLEAVADFDGDGVMEFVWSSSYYEGSAATLSRFKGGVLKELVAGGQGV